jgi:hypothetical protein
MKWNMFGLSAALLMTAAMARAQPPDTQSPRRADLHLRVAVPAKVADKTRSMYEDIEIMRRILERSLWDSSQARHNLVREVAFSPDGKRMATATAEGTVRLWDTATGKAVVSLAHADPHNSLDVQGLQGTFLKDYGIVYTVTLPVLLQQFMPRANQPAPGP